MVLRHNGLWDQCCDVRGAEREGSRYEAAAIGPPGGEPGEPRDLLALAREVVRHRGGGGRRARGAARARVPGRGRDPRRMPRQGDRLGRRQVGAHRAQARGDAHQHRHAGGVPPSRRRAARRRRALHARRRGAVRLEERRERGAAGAACPYLERHGIPLVSIVDTPGSIARPRAAEAALVTGPVREACPMDLTPTTSITLAQVMGDCLAVALARAPRLPARGLPLPPSRRRDRPRRRRAASRS